MVRFFLYMIGCLGALLLAASLLIAATRTDEAVYPWVVYGSYYNNRAEGSLYQVRVDNARSMELITEDEINAQCFTMSPDGLKVAYVAGVAPATYEIRILWLADNYHQTVIPNYHHITGRCPTWSPDSAWLMVMPNDWDETHIYRVNLDPLEVIQLTDEPHLNFIPYLSLDGESIALLSIDQTQSGFEIISTNHSFEPYSLPIIRDDDHIMWLSWSPDNRYLYYAYGYENNALYRVEVETGKVETVVQTDAMGLTSIPLLWSGQTSQFVVILERAENGYFLYTLPEDGGFREIAQTTFTRPCSAQLSPDGQWVVFLKLSSSAQFDLFRVRYSGGIAEQLTSGLQNFVDYECSYWSPDGVYLIYEGWQNSNLDLYRLDLDTQKSSRLTSQITEDKWVGWAAIPHREFAAWRLLIIGGVLLGASLFSMGAVWR